VVADAGTHGCLLDAPIALVPPLLDGSMVGHAVRQLGAVVADAMERTGVPGVAVGVVYRDRLLFAEGFGVRGVGRSDRVDADTVFQVASVSKPVASTIVAAVVGRGKATWSDPVISWYPRFALRDPYVTANATLADLLSHRSGLSTGAGDLLEDLGWDRDYILAALDQQPLDVFRASYHYSNFGFTAGGVAAAAAMQLPWEDLADSMLFGPLGMTSSSYRHADYEARQNRALIHTRLGVAEDKRWAARYVRNADAEAPAGGLSSSVNDMVQFLRLQLGAGTIDGRPVIDGAALQVTRVPHTVMRPATVPGVRTESYGLGWNVSSDDQGRVRLSHSGAFLLGAGTAISLIEGEQLGIVTLTNGQPHGIPEAINNAFLEVAQYGQQRVDWLGFLSRAFEGYYTEGVDPKWTTPPPEPVAPPAEAAFVGTYDNPYYGPLTVTFDGTTLSMAMGPPASPTSFTLTHYDRNTFTFDTVGENAVGTSGAEFTLAPDGTATTVTLAAYDTTGLGTFTRR
jgi:CubicO group peptidase (beta-lactamase class C family)